MEGYTEVSTVLINAKGQPAFMKTIMDTVAQAIEKDIEKTGRPVFNDDQKEIGYIKKIVIRENELIAVCDVQTEYVNDVNLYSFSVSTGGEEDEKALD